MDQWITNVGKPILFEALAAACGEIDEKLGTALAAQIQARESSSRAELETLRAKAALIDQLQEKNVSLQQQLADSKSLSASRSASPPKPAATRARDGSATPHTPSTRTPLGSKSANEALSTLKPSAKRPLPKPSSIDVSQTSLSDLRVEFGRLQDNYRRLYDKYQGTENVRAQLEQRLRAKAKAVTEWQTHADGLKAQSLERLQHIKALRAQLSAQTGRPSQAPQPPTNDLDREVCSTIQNSSSSRVEGTPSLQVDNSSDDTNSSDSEPAGLLSSKHDRTVVNDQPGLSKPMTREDNGEADLPPMPNHGGNDLPQATQVKSEPSSDPIVISEKVVRKRKLPGGDNDHITPFRRKIKTEPDSDPVSVGDSDKFTAHESMDLDADGQLVKTPRKIRHRQAETLILEDEATAEDQLHDQDPVDERDGHQPKVDAGNNNLTERSSALQPLSTNTLHARALPLDVSGSRFRKRRSTAGGIASLGEDGELYVSVRRQTAVARDAASSGLLHDLLNSRTPDRESIILPGGAQTTDASIQTPSRISTPVIHHFPMPEKRPLPFGGTTPKNAPMYSPLSKTTAVSTPKPVNSAALSTSISKSRLNRETPKQGTPLRDRALGELKLLDFKINPAANEGLDYAFTDIVRGRDDRSRLPGDLTVYGEEFRAQARAQRHQTSSLAFTALLENWLGDQAWKLSEMPTAEKEKLWEDAKTAELARMFGRVKHRYRRQTSPPGAWRVDFPSTQEEAAYREEAHKVDRARVSERYREAMRPGGLWLFRDE